jgi:ferric-dicitrate binding protein FerR (iron transport regulator)
MSANPNDEQDPVAKLLRASRGRPSPDAERFDRAWQTVSAEWRSVLERNRRIRRLRIGAAVLATMVAVTLGALYWRAMPIEVATANRVVGEVQVQGNPLQAAQVLLSATTLDTGKDGRTLLDWSNGVQVSVDQGSRIELKSQSEIHVVHGAVYIDTHSDGSQERRLAVTTPFGTARHIGTRFEVYVDSANTRVRVREGSVSFSSEERAPITIAAGQQLSIGDTIAKLEQGPGSHDSAWGWVRSIAPGFAIEGRSAFEALRWLSETGGMRIVYVDEAARTQAQSSTLRGTIEGLDTRKALLAVLAGSGLDFTISDDQVVIRASQTIPQE